MMTDRWRLAELERRMANVLRLGAVTAVEPTTGRVKVMLDTDLITAWLPWLTQRAALDAATWWAPSVGEQVVVLAPGGELAAAVVLPALNQATMPAPSSDPGKRVVRVGTATITLDTATGDLTVVTPGKLKATASQAEITAASVQVTGNVTITGTLTISGDVVAGGKSLMLHTHLYNPGPGNSTPTSPPA